MAKQNIKYELLYKFQTDNKLTIKDLRLLVEAFRRKHVIKDGKGQGKTSGWVGLGTPSQYKSKFFKPLDGDTTPRINHWWLLTEEGEKMMKKMENQFIIPSKPESLYKLNIFLAEFN